MEYPRLQRVLRKYRPRGFEVLSPNIEPGQDSLVLPFYKGNGLEFVPLRGGKDLMKPYGVRGTPSNVLIDGRGFIMFRPWVSGDEDERTLELEIEALLADVKR